MENSATNVSLMPLIVLKFIQPVDPLTANKTTVILSTKPTLEKTPQDKQLSSILAIEYITTSNGNTVFSFTPQNTLLPNTKYYVFLTNGITFTSGKSLMPTSINFTTGNFDVVQPTVNMLNPTNGSTNVSRSIIIQLQFNESVQNVDNRTVILHTGSHTGSEVAIGAITAGK